jgi:hypothetical protein
MVQLAWNCNVSLVWPMNKPEAQSLLTRHLARWRQCSHRELVELLGNQGCDEVIGPSGAAYQIEVDVLWDSKPQGLVRVVGSIDHGGLSAFCPITDSFIVVPEGTA